MSRLDGAHSHGHSGGGVGLVAVVVLVLIAAAAKPAEQAARTAGHILSVAAEVLVIGLAVLAVLAVAAVLGWAVVKAHRWHSTRQGRTVPVPIAAVSSVNAVSPAEVGSFAPQAIEAPKPRTSWPVVVPDDASALTKAGA